MKEIQLFNREQNYWKKANIKLFGIEPIDDSIPFSDIQKHLDECCLKYWNVEQPCQLANGINSGVLDKNFDRKLKNSYRLSLNFYNMCIDVSAVYSVEYKGTNVDKEFKICAIPTPCQDLTWIINRTKYVPRVTAVRDYYTFLGKVDFQTIKGEGWTYDIFEDKFTCVLKQNPFEPTLEEIYNNRLSKRSRALLQSVLDEPLSIDNFKQALGLLPTFESNSIFNYKFARIEYFEDIIFKSGRYAQPTKKILLGINQMFASQNKVFYTGERNDGCLIRAESPIYALENFRTVVNIYNGEYKPAFTYTDTIGFFDAFKTVTSSSAGRQRLLLDNVIVKDGMLWIEENGVEKNMFEYMIEPQPVRLSCLSSAPFGNNDKPKRIMMNAKLTSQSVPLKEELNPLTHLINARVGFTDIKGFTYGDSIIISESFANRLRTYSKDILYFETKDKVVAELEKNKDNISIELLQKIYPSTAEAILSSYENVKVDRFDYVEDYGVRIFLSWEIPFRLGDKITNRHGAKGTVGKIVPDAEMPYLTKKVGNMEEGHLEVIISGFSTMRRGSLGQIFEAWANASGIEYQDGEDFIANMIEKYSDQMREYANNSVITFNGETNIIPVGIITMMRVYHHASIHISESKADGAFDKVLKLGEMEKFNLVASGSINILKELSIRSMHKHIGANKMVAEMEETRELPNNPSLSLKLATVLKSIGYDIRVNGKSLTKSDLSNIEFDEQDMTWFNSIESNGGIL